jgi:hypothetical protein
MLVNAGSDPPDWFIGACTVSSRFTVFAGYHRVRGINDLERLHGAIGGL